MLWSAIARLLAIVTPFVPAVRSQELVRLALVIANQRNTIGKVLEPPHTTSQAESHDTAQLGH